MKEPKPSPQPFWPTSRQAWRVEREAHFRYILGLKLTKRHIRDSVHCSCSAEQWCFNLHLVGLDMSTISIKKVIFNYIDKTFLDVVHSKMYIPRRAGGGGFTPPPSGFSQIAGKRRRAAPPNFAYLFSHLFRILRQKISTM